MLLETKTITPGGRFGRMQPFVVGVVHHDGGLDVARLAREVDERGLNALSFADSLLFDDHERGVRICRDMRVHDMRVLWSARLDAVPTGGLLEAMRLAGCQCVDMRLDPDEAVEGLFWARHYGFDLRILNLDGEPYTAETFSYTVAEREAVAERLSGLHTAQFDLAVAYFKARRYLEVMRPLAKAMTLGFPMNELCLNLLACLAVAKHYPEQASGLLDQASYGRPHPVVWRNRLLLDNWLARGGDVQGIRLELEPSVVFSVF